MNFPKFLRTSFLQNTSSGCFWRLLLIIWAMSSYLQMFFQLYYYCSRITARTNYNKKILHGISRSSRPEVFWRKAALKIYAEFTGKHLCWSLQACNFIKKRLQYRCFPVNFGKFLRTHFSKNFCERLLLHLKYYNPANNTAEAVAEYRNSNSKRKIYGLQLRSSFFFKVLNLDYLFTKLCYFHNVCWYSGVRCNKKWVK